MTENKKDNKEELSSEEKAARAHQKSIMNAERLQNAISMMTWQAEKEQKAREEAKSEYEDRMRDNGQLQIAKQKGEKIIHPTIITAATQFGYDARGGGLKVAVNQLRDAVKALDSKNQEPAQLVDDLEEKLRDMQDGWMLGNRVDPNAAKRLTSNLGNKFEEMQGLDPEKYKIVKQHITDFSTKIDKEIDRLQQKAVDQVHTKECTWTYGSIVRQNVFSTKLTSRASGLHSGDCALMWLSDAKAEVKANTVIFPGGAQRGYVYVGSRPRANDQSYDQDAANNKLYYVNKDLDTVTPVSITKEQQLGLIEGDSYASKFWGLFGVTPLRLPEAPGTGKILEYGQEKLLQEVVSHHPGQRNLLAEDLVRQERDKGMLSGGIDLPAEKRFSRHVFVNRGLREEIKEEVQDWKKILPLAFDNYAAEMAQRKKEEADFFEEYKDPELAAQMALDKAIERLEQRKGEELTFNYMDDLKFNIMLKKDDEGKMVVRVHYENHHNPKNVAAAMKAMIERCHEQDPNAEVFLSCTPLSELRYGGERVVKRYSDRMINQLEHAVIAAENSHRRGIYTGLEIDRSLEEVISSHPDSKKQALAKDLMERIGKLHKEWVEKVEEPNQKKEQQAVARFGESKTGDLGVLLARAPEGGADLKSIAHELQDALKTKADATIDAKVLNERKIGELKRETQKIENRYQHLALTSRSITDHLKDAEKKIEECKEDVPKLSEYIERLEAFNMAQVQVNKEAKNLVEVADNHKKWFDILDSEGMDAVLNIQLQDKQLLSAAMEDVKRDADQISVKSSTVGGNLVEIQRHLDKAQEYRRQAGLKAGAAPSVNAQQQDVVEVKQQAPRIGGN